LFATVPRAAPLLQRHPGDPSLETADSTMIEPWTTRVATTPAPLVPTSCAQSLTTSSAPEHAAL